MLALGGAPGLLEESGHSWVEPGSSRLKARHKKGQLPACHDIKVTAEDCLIAVPAGRKRLILFFFERG